MRRPGRFRGPRPIGEIVRALVRRKRFRQKGRYSGLTEAWRELAGQGVAARTRIRSFEEGRLVIEVETPALLHELNGFMKEHLLQGLQAMSAGRDVAELRLRLARDGGSRSDT